MTAQSTTISDPKRQKRILIISGVVLTLFSVYLLAFLLPDFLRSVAGPAPMTLSEAAEIATDENRYVALTDGAWECDTISYISGYSSSTRRIETRSTEIFAVNPSGSAVALVLLSGKVGCDDLDDIPLEGYLTRMTPERQQELTNEVRLARFINGESYVELCGFCGTTNSLIGTLFGFAFALLGVGLLVWGLRKSGELNDER